jgi:hypothetical protein
MRLDSQGGANNARRVLRVKRREGVSFIREGMP